MLNASLPFHFYAYVRAEFLRDFEAGQGQFEPALVFGVSSHCSRALGWHVLTESGATLLSSCSSQNGYSMTVRIYRSEAFKQKQKMREESQRIKQQMAVRFVKDNPDIPKLEVAKRFGVGWNTLKKWLEA